MKTRKNFKKNGVALALATCMALPGLSFAQMYVNPDNTGQVLLYPYYSVRNGLNTYVSIINTTERAKAVRVRFHEALNSRDVFDFNLYLSPRDVWAGAVVPDDNGVGARLITHDKSCTAPKIPASGVAFSSAFYSGTADVTNNYFSPAVDGFQADGEDGETTSLDRTREGYIEVIEMGEVSDAPTVERQHESYNALIHVDGTPGDCQLLAQPRINRENFLQFLNITRPQGGLAGGASLLAPEAGTDFSYDAVAINDFVSTDRNIWGPESSALTPDLRSGDPTSSVFHKLGSAPVQVFTGTFSSSQDAVSSVLTHQAVINEYMLDYATDSGTDWVVTMPTKHFYVPVARPDFIPHELRASIPPFTTRFWDSGACEPVRYVVYDREEQVLDRFSPGENHAQRLCYEANVITFNDSNVLRGDDVPDYALSVPFSTTSNDRTRTYEHGWVEMEFASPLHILAGPPNTFTGLPVIGFMVQDFYNQNAQPGRLAVYGGNFVHKYTTVIN